MLYGRELERRASEDIMLKGWLKISALGIVATDRLEITAAADMCFLSSGNPGILWQFEWHMYTQN